MVSASFVLACGGGEKGAVLPPNPDVIVGAPAGRGLVFDKTAYTAVAGDVGIEYDNHDVQAHTMIITDASGETVPGFPRMVVGAHRKAGATVTLQPGVYNLICDIHLPSMVATLTINP